jgi:hypothetical protein
MPFVARARFPEKKPPARGYIYDSPAAPIEQPYGSVDDVIRHLDSELDNHPRIIGKADFLIPFAWGYKDKKFVEVFGFFDSLKNWPDSNPEVYSWVFLNGKHKPKRRSICCGEALQILGKEMEYRLRTKSFEQYMIKGAPNADKLGIPHDTKILGDCILTV